MEIEIHARNKKNQRFSRRSFVDGTGEAWGLPPSTLIPALLRTGGGLKVKWAEWSVGALSGATSSRCFRRHWAKKEHGRAMMMSRIGWTIFHNFQEYSAVFWNRLLSAKRWQRRQSIRELAVDNVALKKGVERLSHLQRADGSPNQTCSSSHVTFGRETLVRLLLHWLSNCSYRLISQI